MSFKPARLQASDVEQTRKCIGGIRGDLGHLSNKICMRFEGVLFAVELNVARPTYADQNETARII